MTEKPDINPEKAKVLLKENMHTLKKNIKKLLFENKVTQHELAMRMNSSPEFLSYFLRKGGNAKLEFLGRMAYAFDTTVSELIKK